MPKFYFIGFFPFLKNKIFEIYVQKYFINIFLLKLPTNSIPNSASFVSLATLYFISNRFCLNVCANYFFTLLLKVKTDDKQQEKYLHIVRNL